MRAIILERHGGPEVLEIAARPEPRPGPGEVAVAVAFAGVNFSDTMARATGHRVPSLPFIPGIEVSGVVLELGEDVTELQIGQSVVASVASGGYAEIAVVDQTAVLPLPEGLSLKAAAALPTVLPTAYLLLHEIARLRHGDVVLIHSAAGAVGTAAGQLARNGGAAAVYGVVSTMDKAAFAAKHGYDDLFLMETFDQDVRRVTDERGVDIALDPLGGDIFRRTLASVGRFGRLVSYGNASGSSEPWQVGAADTYGLGRSVAGFSLPRLAGTDPVRLRTVTALALRLVSDGEVVVPVTAEFDLADSAEAHRLLESRTSTGKILLRVAGG